MTKVTQAAAFFIASAFISLPAVRASPGTSGAAFLQIPVGAGPAALGSAYTTQAVDAYAPVYNPAGLGFMRRPEAAGQHLSYLESIHYEYLAGAWPLRPGKGLALSAQYLGTGDIPATGPQEEDLGTFSSHYGAYSAAYGQRLSERLALGIAAKWIQAKLADVSANAFATDFGALYRVSDMWSWAATLNNLGTRMTFADQSDPLPLEGHLGVGLRPDRRWNLLAELVMSRDLAAAARFGAEWSPIPEVALRGGYRTETLKGLSPLAGLSLGLGLRLWGQELAYAWVPYGDLGNSQYLSLQVRFGPEQAQKNLIQLQDLRRHRRARSPVPEGSEADDTEYRQLLMMLEHETEPSARASRDSQEADQ